MGPPPSPVELPPVPPPVLPPVPPPLPPTVMVEPLTADQGPHVGMSAGFDVQEVEATSVRLLAGSFKRVQTAWGRCTTSPSTLQPVRLSSSSGTKQPSAS